MLPRALLFSSDEQTATVFGEVLPEFQMELVHCREIFAAVEALTTRNFQIILIDWVQELEASFLLNMARELKSTRDTCSLVIVDAKLAAVLAINPDGFLEKPFTAELARQALLSALTFKKSRGESDRRAPMRTGQTVPPGKTTDFQRTIASSPARLVSLTCDGPDAAMSFQESESSETRVSTAKTTTARRRRFVLHEASVPKKAAALLCLLTLLVAVVHGEQQLGYFPGGLLSYRNFGDLLSPKEQALAPERELLTSNPDSASTLGAHGEEKLATNHYVVDRSGRVAVRPVFREGYSTFSRAAAPFAEAKPGDSGTSVTEMLLPDGANPLIPSSLYLSPQRLLGLPPTGQTGLSSTNWSVGPTLVPEETSRSLLIHQVLPRYPLEALRAGLAGPVVFQALVGRDGSIEDLKLVHGYFALGLAAVDAVRQWRFRPYRVNGEVVEMQTLLTISFPVAQELSKPNSNGSLMTYDARR